MPFVKSTVQGMLVMGNVLATVVFQNQPLDEVFDHFTVVSIMPRVPKVVTVPRCITHCGACLHPGLDVSRSFSPY